MTRKKPIIGVIGRPDRVSDQDAVICIWEKIRKAIVQKGGIPLLVLPTQNVIYEDLSPRDVPKLTEEEKEDLKSLIDCCDGLLMPGAYKWYEYDRFIYQYACTRDFPILGICAGMQTMASMDNDQREEEVKRNAKNETAINHHQRNQKYVHYVDIIDNTLLKKIVGVSRIEVNSKHNYHIQTTTDYIISAYAEDGLIEAIENPNQTFALGIQWHPETMLEYDEYANKIMDAFIESCQKK